MTHEACAGRQHQSPLAMGQSSQSTEHAQSSGGCSSLRGRAPCRRLRYLRAGETWEGHTHVSGRQRPGGNEGTGALSPCSRQASRQGDLGPGRLSGLWREGFQVFLVPLLRWGSPPLHVHSCSSPAVWPLISSMLQVFSAPPSLVACGFSISSSLLLEAAPRPGLRTCASSWHLPELHMPCCRPLGRDCD